MCSPGWNPGTEEDIRKNFLNLNKQRTLDVLKSQWHYITNRLNKIWSWGSMFRQKMHISIIIIKIFIIYLTVTKLDNDEEIEL